MSKVLVVKNIPHEDPGIFEDIGKSRGFEFTTIDLSLGQDLLPLNDFDGVIICGGPNSANDDNKLMKTELTFVEECLEAEVPFFGICLGMQVLGKVAGGTVVTATQKEIGFIDPNHDLFEVVLSEKAQKDPFFAGLGANINVLQLHGEMVELGGNIELLGTGKWCEVQAIKVGKNAYGMQAHVELSEEKLEVWLELDEGLTKLDHDDVRNTFNSIKESYLHVGTRIANNFFDLIDAQ